VEASHKVHILPNGFELRSSLEEHIVDVNKKSDSLSVISNHRLETNHKINWNDVKIVDNEPSCIKRLICEMIYLKKQPYGLNKQSDISELLSDTNLSIIELLSI